MSNVQELYESRIRPLVPAERLQLARLILDDLGRSEDAVNVSDEWGDDDMADLAAFAAGHAVTVLPAGSIERSP
jgi:hypothetical protein